MSEGSVWLWLFFRFRGRVGRQVYLLANAFLMLLVGLPYYRFALLTPGTQEADAWQALFVLAVLFGFWCTIALGAKRLHDLGKPGAASVLLLMPVVSLIAFAALCLIPGNPGPNEHGGRADEPS